MGKRSVEKERYWREVLSRFERSGMKVRGFCEQAGIKENQFYTWRRELGQRDERLRGVERAVSGVSSPASMSKAAAFAAVHVVGPSEASPSPIEIIVGNGKRVAVTTGFDPAALSQVLRVVEGWTC